MHKNANQSTGVQQDLGTETRPYTYTIEIQNNYTNPSTSVVTTDTLPDGIEFLGMNGSSDVMAVDAGFGIADPATGETPLQWTLGDLAPGQSVTIVYNAGIRYDYYGTDNGGNNRPTAVFDGRETTSTPIAHKTGFTNTAGLISTYKGSLVDTITPTDSDSASGGGHLHHHRQIGHARFRRSRDHGRRTRSRMPPRSTTPPTASS